MHDAFATKKAEAVLLVDAENTLNSISKQAFLHKIKYVNVCPHIASFVCNCYNVLARLLQYSSNSRRHHIGRSNCVDSLFNRINTITKTTSDLLS